MVELQREVVWILAAADTAEKIVADLESVFPHGAIA